jgi:hypothetical protein
MVMLVILTWVYMFGLWHFWMQFNAGCATEGCKPVGKSCFLMQRTLALSFRRMIYLRYLMLIFYVHELAFYKLHVCWDDLDLLYCAITVYERAYLCISHRDRSDFKCQPWETGELICTDKPISGIISSKFPCKRIPLIIDMPNYGYIEISLWV